MKTRNEIYQGEGAKLLRFITTYHTLKYDQVLQLFSRHEQYPKACNYSIVRILSRLLAVTKKVMLFIVNDAPLFDEAGNQ